jgi:hypothetical protein
MTTKALASELGATRNRQRPLVQQLPSGSIVTASTSKNVECATISLPANNSPAINRLLPSVPHSQSWALSQEANKKSGTCSVCFATRQLHNKDGIIHRHGPRDNPCSGSHLLPLSQSTITASQLVQATSTSIRPAVFTLSNSATVISSGQQSSGDTVQHPVHCALVLKRIPKNARVHVGNLLQKLINDVLQHPSSLVSWSRLLGFPSACLTKPCRGGKSRNLTTAIINQVHNYSTGSDQGPAQLTRRVAQPCSRSVLNSEQKIAAMAAAKLEDGDVKGAVRLLCSDDKLAVVNATTLEELKLLHPSAPLDRRSASACDLIPPLQVSPLAIKKAILSFPNGSAGGPDGLRPQLLKDLLLGAPDDHPLLIAITELTNLQLRGHTPSSVRSTLFGAKLLAIRKKTGGIRPIAVGYVWRRLTAKVACSHVKESSSVLLAPRQLGFGIAGGAEAAVRAARRYVDSMKPDEVFVKIDFRNAFNTLRRDSILEAVAKHFPELLHFAESTISQTSTLQFGDFSLQSDEGAQQGDPLGPLYFCLTFKKLLDDRKSEFVIGFLDDVAIGGEAACALEDFIQLEEAAKSIGLQMNHNKCEIVGLSDDTRFLFTSRGINLPETTAAQVILLGSPLSAGQHLDALLQDKHQELQRLTKRLEFMPSHDSLYLLRNVLSAPRLMYLLRTAPCTGSLELMKFDIVLRESLSITLNIDLDDDRWIQASLPVRWGGLGIRSVVSLAPSAYLASAASTKELTASLLPPRLRDITDSGFATATSAWIKLTTSQSSVIGPPSPAVSTLPLDSTTSCLPDSTVQRDWDSQVCEVQADQLLVNADQPVVRARLLASRSPGSGDWLGAMPLSTIGLKMDNTSIRIAVGLRLGAPVVRSHICVCGATVSVNGHHGLSCRYGSGRHSRHNQVNELLCRALVSAGSLATREPHSLCTNSGKRPDGVTQVPWNRGRCLAWDATCPDTFAASHILLSSTQSGSVAAAAERKKCDKYADITAGVDFIPVAIETSGVWGEQALNFVKDIGRRLAATSHEPRSTMFLRQRISMAVQRGNAFCVLDTLRRTASVDY